MPKRSLPNKHEFDQLDRAIQVMLYQPDTESAQVGAALAPLLRIAGDLRDLPTESFKARLKSDLERKSSMATATESAIRTFAAPRLAFKKAAKAIEFYKNAFWARETFRFENELGLGHAEMMIGDSVIMFAEEWPEGGRYSAETWGHSPVSMNIYRTVTPYIVAEQADALINFLTKTFEAKENFRAIGSAGGIHAEVQLGDSMLMIGGGGPDLAWRGDPLPQAFHVYVRDCDATYRRALEHGATSIDKPVDQEYGERSASLKDAAGNFWYVATYKGDTYKWEGAPDVQPCLHPLRAEPVINFLKRAFGAEEIARYASPDGVIHHASIKIGDSYMEMGEAHGKYQPMPAMFYLYVPDCDAVYRRALAAGATSISEPKDQTYGDRSGGVKDMFGNQWYIATHVKDM